MDFEEREKRERDSELTKQIEQYAELLKPLYSERRVIRKWLGDRENERKKAARREEKERVLAANATLDQMADTALRLYGELRSIKDVAFRLPNGFGRIKTWRLLSEGACRILEGDLENELLPCVVAFCKDESRWEAMPTIDLRGRPQTTIDRVGAAFRENGFAVEFQQVA